MFPSHVTTTVPIKRDHAFVLFTTVPPERTSNMTVASPPRSNIIFRSCVTGLILYLSNFIPPIEGFDGVVKNFILKDDKGLVHLTKSCSGAGLGGVPYRDGSFEYYIKEPKRTDDLKAMGPFIQASVEIELMRIK